MHAKIDNFVFITGLFSHFFWYIFSCENVKFNLTLKPTKDSYTLGFLRTKNPWLVFRLKYKFSKQNFLEFSFMEKMLIIQLHSGYSHDKKSLVSVSVETRNFETKLFRVFIYGKNTHHTIALWVFL